MKRVLLGTMVLLLVTGMAFAGGGRETAAEESAADFTGEFDWKRFEGQTIKLLLNQHPYTNGMMDELDTFEQMTGINVEYDIFPEEEYFDRLTIALSSGSTEYDAFMGITLQTCRLLRFKPATHSGLNLPGIPA
jgi:multiple sugar transport system substrate-binding protein